MAKGFAICSSSFASRGRMSSGTDSLTVAALTAASHPIVKCHIENHAFETANKKKTRSMGRGFAKSNLSEPKSIRRLTATAERHALRDVSLGEAADDRMSSGTDSLTVAALTAASHPIVKCPKNFGSA